MNLIIFSKFKIGLDEKTGNRRKNEFYSSPLNFLSLHLFILICVLRSIGLWAFDFCLLRLLFHVPFHRLFPRSRIFRVNER